MEGAITDVQSSDIIDNDLSPNFKNGDYYAGFDQAVNSLEQAAAGEYKERNNSTNNQDGGGNVLGFIIIVVIIIVIILRNRGGGRGGGMVSRRVLATGYYPLCF